MNTYRQFIKNIATLMSGLTVYCHDSKLVTESVHACCVSQLQHKFVNFMMHSLICDQQSKRSSTPEDAD